jgi:carbon storage regulator
VVGEKVRIGIQAPRAVPVYRREVYVQIQREQATAVTDAAPGTASEVDAPPS